MPKTLPLFGRGYASKSPSVTTQRLVNGYRDTVLDEDKSPLPIFGAPGLDLLYDLGSPVQGGIVIGSTIYAVAANVLYSINSLGIIGVAGTITASAAPAYFAWNGTQILIVNGAGGWIYVPTTGVLTKIVAAAFPAAPTTCTWLAGYFFVTQANSGTFTFSAIGDGLTWPALQFDAAEMAPDNLIRIEQDAGELILFGERTTEFWGMSGDANVVRRIGSAGIEWGIIAAPTVTKFNTGLAFLAQNRLGEVQSGVLQGHNFMPFSDGDPEINNAINNRSRAYLQAGTAFSYFMDGHAFYQLNFPDASYLYDDLTKSWSGRSSGTFGARHYADQRLALSQQPYVTDYRNGRIYLLDKTSYTDNNDPQQLEITTKHIFNGGDQISVNEIAIEIEAGDGLASGQGSDPQIMCSWSKDGGRTWGNEVWRTMGPIGRYRKRAVWRNCGRAIDWSFKFRISDPIKRVIVAAEVEVEP